MAVSIIDFVDKNFNCEDIGLNFVVNAALGSSGGPAPLYVDSLHLIGDFGKEPGKGLHLRQSHTKLRDTCLHDFNREFSLVSGSSLPIQTKTVRVKREGDSHSVLEYVSYAGHRMRRHVDCYDYSTEDACSWILPTVHNFTSTYVDGGQMGSN